MTKHSDSEQSPIPAFFPWVLGGAALLLYFITLNPWITLQSLSSVIHPLGLEWRAQATGPLHYLLTLPANAFSGQAKFFYLNGLSAVLAALTIVQLARSVRILPQDRTRDQRSRETGPFSVLWDRSAWIPPLLATGALALQLSFWEHATSASQEMLDLFLFAFCIRCLLEYRLDERNSWLYRLAVVYGVGIANNWGFIAWLPLFLIAMVWIKGRSFFNFSFFFKMLGLALLGLTFYLVLPIAQSFSQDEWTFWEILKANLSIQKAQLLYAPRSRVLILSLFSILPIFLAGIRWPSSFGDISAVGSWITNWMFYLFHIAYLALCLWVVFDPEFSPRQLGLNRWPFLTLYYLAALSIGYYSGYVALVLGKNALGHHQRPGAFDGLGKAVAALLWVAVLAIPAGLAWKNGPWIQLNKRTPLNDYASELAATLKGKNATLISDNMSLLVLMNSYYLKTSQASPLIVDSTSLGQSSYQKYLSKKYGPAWPQVELENATNEVALVLGQLTSLAQKQPTYYLQPGFEFEFEHGYTIPEGFLHRYYPYAPGQVLGRPMNNEELNREATFWERIEKQSAPIQRGVERNHFDSAVVGQYISRDANSFGVRLQEHQHLDRAAKLFNFAVLLNQENPMALINQGFNRVLAQKGNKYNYPEKIQSMLLGPTYRANLDRLVQLNGPVDEPELMFVLSRYLVDRSRQFYHQALPLLLRVQSLEKNPTFQLATALTDCYLMLEQKTEAEKQLKKARDLVSTNKADQITLVDLQGRLLYLQDQQPEAETYLMNQAKTLGDPQVYRILQTFYLERASDVKGTDPAKYAQFVTKALGTSDAILKFNPGNLDELLKKGAMQVDLQDYKGAVETLTKLLSSDPRNVYGLINRAIAYKNLRQSAQAREDFENLRELAPQLHTVYLGLGDLADAEKNTEEAIKNYERFLEYGPRNSPDYLRVKKRLTELKAK